MPVTFFPFSAFVPDGGHYGRQLDRAQNVLPIHGGFRSIRKKSTLASVQDGPMTGLYVHIYQQSLAEQVARPDGDTTPGLWLPSTGTTLNTQLKEEIPSDADFIFSGGAPSNDVCKLSLSDVLTPSAGNHTVRWRYAATGCSTMGVLAAVTSITRSGTTATVTTTAAHGLSSGNYVALYGAGQTEYTGVFVVTVTGGTTFTIQVTGTPATPATGTITFAKITTASVTSITRVGATATVTTALAHGLSTGDWTYHLGANQPEYNGVFKITFVDATHYTVTVTGTPATPATGTIVWAKPWALKLELVEGSTVRFTDLIGGVSDGVYTQRSTTFAAPAIADYTNLFFQLTGTIPGTAVFVRPVSDDSVGAWTTNGGGTSSLYAAVDETPASDTDFVQSSALAAGQSASYRLNLDTSTQPFVDRNHTVRYRYLALNAGMSLTVTLLQNTTTIASWSHTGIAAGAWVTASQILTSPQRAAIKAGGGYSNLKLQFDASYPASVTSTAQQSSRALDTYSSTGWAPTGAGSLEGCINEASPSDAEHIDSSAFIGTPDVIFDLVPVAAPHAAGDHVLKVRAYRLSAGTSSVVATLRNGAAGAAITVLTLTATTTPTTYTYALTTTEAALVSSYGNVTLELFTGATDVAVSWAEFSVPQPRVMEISFCEFELPPAANVAVSWAEYRVPTSDTRYRGDQPTRFTGSRTNLYTFDTPSFVDVSEGGPLAAGAGPYGPAGAVPGSWFFGSWGNNVFATNFVDPVQWRQNNSGQFADLITGTDKPKARFVCGARDHVMLASINPTSVSGHEVDEVWWSAFANAQSFDRSTATQCDSRRLYTTPGQIMGLVGGDTPIVFKRRSIIALQWIGGVLVWQPIVVSRSVGTPFPRSIVPGQDQVLFWGGDCFYSLAEGGQPQPLGRGVIARFLTDADYSDGAIQQTDPTEMRIEDQIMVGWYDPSCGVYLWHYIGAGDSSWKHNRAVAYDPAEDRWAVWNLTGLASLLNNKPSTSANIAALATSPNTTTSARNELKGTVGVDWNGTATTWFRFDDSTTYQATFRSKWFAIQLDDAQAQQPLFAQVEGIIPVFSTALGTGGFWPNVNIKLEMALEPRSQLGYQTESYDTNPAADQRQMLPFRLGGLWARVTVTVAEMSAAIMDAFEGVYIQWNTRGRGGA